MPEVELDQQGSNRVQILTHPVALPGHCSVCGYAGGEDRKFIDVDLTVDFYGAVIFCTFCVVSMGEVLGFVTPEIYDNLADRHGAALQELTRLGTENDRLSNALNAMLAGRDSYSNRALVEESKQRSIDSNGSVEPSNSTESEPGTDNSGTAESTPKPRPASVRKSTSNEQSDLAL